MTIVLTPIGVVRSTRATIEDDDWDRETASLVLSDAFEPDALAGLDTFSHVEVLFHMDRVPEQKIETAARHPRNNADWPKVGIFAQRGKNRPNRIGLSVCRVLAVEGRVVHVGGLDAIDGSPILDIKPYVKQFGPRGDVVEPLWMDELMRGYYEK
jgi:tRNA (adenine37-N6)-methyltransferase